MKCIAIATLIISLFSISLKAQKSTNSFDSLLNSTMNDTSVIDPNLAPMTTPTVMANKWNQIHTKYFTINIGFALILDHNIASQDSTSNHQVGSIGTATEFRGDRIILSGQLLFFKHPWRYMLSANFNGLDAPPGDKTFSLIDWNIEIPVGKGLGWLTVGKTKEGVGYEYILPGTQAFFTERGSGTPAFVRQRNIGVRYSNSIFDRKMTYTFGFFNNWIETGKSFSANGSQFTARVSGLPMYSSDRDLLHLAVGYKYTGATDGIISFKARPEANTAPSFVNTAAFAAKGANMLMLEGLKVFGPLSFLAEYMNAFVSSSQFNNPSFYYWQLASSWFITGENRRYNRTTGNLGKLIPAKNFKFRRSSGTGTFELGARYTQTNLSVPGINGGKVSRFTTAISWYPNAHFRYEINYGIVKLDKSNLIGTTNFWQFRIQFEL